MLPRQALQSQTQQLSLTPAEGSAAPRQELPLICGPFCAASPRHCSAQAAALGFPCCADAWKRGC